MPIILDDAQTECLGRIWCVTRLDLSRGLQRAGEVLLGRPASMVPEGGHPTHHSAAPEVRAARQPSPPLHRASPHQENSASPLAQQKTPGPSHFGAAHMNGQLQASVLAAHMAPESLFHYEEQDSARRRKAEDISNSRKRKLKKPKDPKAPKRFVSAFLHWVQDVRETERSRHPHLSMAALMRDVLTPAWMSIDQPTRAKYERIAKEDRDRYFKEMESYHPSEEFKEKLTTWKQSMKRARRLRRPQKDPNAPKRPLSSYMIFSNSVRPKLTEENPGMQQKDLVRAIGEQWNKMSPEERKEFEDLASQQRDEYDREMREYLSAAERDSKYSAAIREGHIPSNPFLTSHLSDQQVRDAIAQHERGDLGF